MNLREISFSERTSLYAVGSSCMRLPRPLRGLAMTIGVAFMSLRGGRSPTWQSNGTDERVCTNSAVPAPAGTCPRPTEGSRWTAVGWRHASTDREAADSADERVCTNLAVPATARPVVAPYGEVRSTDRRARRPRRADREAADSADERVCTRLVVPRRGHVPALQYKFVRVSEHHSHSPLVLSP